jgi:hypothetical protein
MGPVALFDKSFLQALTLDEAVWFDRFFLGVICPIFFIETLADLAKGEASPRPAETIVREISDKVPDLSGTPCGFHVDLVIANLMGHELPLDGRIPRPGGHPVKGGAVYRPTTEDVAFQRWQAGEFYEVERTIAADWRARLSATDLRAVARELRRLGFGSERPKTLEDAGRMAKALVGGSESPMARFALMFALFNVPAHLHREIYEQWERNGRPSFFDFAPYAAFALTIEVFFNVAIEASFISPDRVSNRTDIAYLFYLPFCNVFVSQDALHRRCAPLFMRPDQEFVWGIDLKAGLGAVNRHFLQLSEEEREQGVMRFARVPPEGNLVADLWDKHLRPGHRTESDSKPSPENEADLVARLTAFSEQSPLADWPVEDPEMISIMRSVRKRRGRWRIVPKGIGEDVDPGAT